MVPMPAVKDRRSLMNSHAPAFQLDKLELVEGWAEDDSTVHARFAFPIAAGSGATSTSLVYFEIEPGRRLSPHKHTAEEVLFVIEGTAFATVGSTSQTLLEGGVAVIPSMVLHNVENTGSDLLRAVGFFSALGMTSYYEHVIMPMQTKVLVTPFPDA